MTKGVEAKKVKSECNDHNLGEFWRTEGREGIVSVYRCCSFFGCCIGLAFCWLELGWMDWTGLNCTSMTIYEISK
jgi:hypothetical protein